MKKILYCYYSFPHIKYTPLDIGYEIICMKEKDDLKFEILSLHLNANKKEKTIDIEKIKKIGAKTIIFHIENVIWSKIFALKATLEIIHELKKDLSDIVFQINSNKLNLNKINNERNIIIHKPSPVFNKSKSPYLNNVFDEFFKKQQKIFKGNFIGFIQTSIGCHYKCYFCYRSVRQEKIILFDIKRVYDEIEYLFNNFSIKKFFIIDDCFIINNNRLEKFLKEFEKRKKTNPNISNISLSIMTRPESMSKYSVFLLNSLNIKTVQIGIQTINPNLQHYMSRNIPISKFKEIKEWLNEYNIKLEVDLIFGLPYDTIEFFKKSLDYALELYPSKINVKQFYMNPGTLFDLENDKYDIKVDKKISLYLSPYVKKSKNIDSKYMKDAYNYIKNKQTEHHEIIWKWLSEFGNWYD